MPEVNFPELFKHCKIGSVDLPNRIILPPMTTNFSNEGLVSERFEDYYVERAKGGAGLIIVEDAIVDFPLGAHAVDSLRIDEDRFIPGLRRLTKKMKAYGCKVALMLSHAGRRAGRVEKRSGLLEVTEGRIPVAPSSLPNPAVGYIVPKELTIYEIEELVQKFAYAALRAKECGFDIVQFHAAHFYLINQFLSPWCNRRSDKYGGDFEGRFKFLGEIISATKELLGDDYPLMCRLNAEEQVEDGLSRQDMQQIAIKLEHTGVKAILLTMGSAALGDSPDIMVPMVPDRFAPGPLVPYAAEMKNLLNIPVGVANKINSPQFAEKVLSDGAADLVAMGRTLFADPALPNKAKMGQLEDIRPCIGCLNCIQRVINLGLPIECSVNPAVGRERELELTPAPVSKRVLVAGGGPGGMEAARVARLVGHEVTLYENESRLGGQLNIAMQPPGKSPEIPNLQRYMENQLRKLGVNIQLGSAVTRELVQELDPDVLVIAIGAKPICPEIPGMEKNNVVAAVDVLEGKSVVSGRVVIIGGGEVGLETAEFLAEKGNSDIVVLEMLPDVAKDMPNIRRHLLLMSLRQKGVKIMTRMEATQITESEVIVNFRNGSKQIGADAIILALGSRPDKEAVDSLKGIAKKTLVIGDCIEARNIRAAIREGYEIAASL